MTLNNAMKTRIVTFRCILCERFGYEATEICPVCLKILSVMGWVQTKDGNPFYPVEN